MDLNLIHSMQKNLKRAHLIPSIQEAIIRGDFIEPVLLLLVEGRVYCRNGHHRIEAYKRAGRKFLHSYEYLLVEP
jgi:uncharacterized ParB-like nuclease family protein